MLILLTSYYLVNIYPSSPVETLEEIQLSLHLGAPHWLIVFQRVDAGKSGDVLAAAVTVG